MKQQDCNTWVHQTEVGALQIVVTGFENY